MINISGTVLGDVGEEIAGANIEVVGENRFATADNNGRFNIGVTSMNSILKFTHVSYEWDTISASEFKKTGKIILFLKTELLNEVTINPRPKPTKTDNSLLWILGIIFIGGIAISMSKSDKK